MEIRTGQFGVFKNEQFNLMIKDSSSCRLIIRKENISEKQKIIGFKEYAKSVFVLDINNNELDSAFNVLTFCIYQGFKFQVTEISSEKLLRIWPSVEAQAHFGDYSKHGYDPHIDIEEHMLEEIWEERIPIVGFRFDVEPIFYLKKNTL